MESKKLEKPCENATFQALQGVIIFLRAFLMLPLSAFFTAVLLPPHPDELCQYMVLSSI